jgi:type II secretory pathway component PulJ
LLADWARRAPCRRDERGTTAAELMVVTALLGTVLAVVFSVLISVQNTENRANVRSQTNDQVRLAIEQIDRQVRSGNMLYDPASEGSNAGTGIAPGFSMRIYTQANGLERCVQWRVMNGTLQSRSWTQTWQLDNQVSGWRTVAEHVVNGTGSPPFSLDAGTRFGQRLVNIDMIANVRSDTGSNVEAKSSVTGRNTQYGYDPVVCGGLVATPGATIPAA